jgi:hypothetical protein
MGLVTRLVSPADGEIKLPVHQFTAALGEYKRGELSGAAIIAMFSLSAGEQTTLSNWLSNIDLSGQTATEIRTEVEDILELGEQGLYDVATVTSRLSSI